MKIETKKSLLVIPVLLLVFFPVAGNARPIQDINLAASSNTVYEGQPFAVFVDYDAYDPATPSVHVKAGGLGIHVFFDSTKVTYTGYDSFAPATIHEFPTTVPDTSDLDNDPLTDMYIQMSWLEFDNPTWPEGTLPQCVAVLDFMLITSEATSIGVDVFSKSLSDYVVSGLTITGLERIPGDFDCDGVVELDDCVNMLRLLSGIGVTAAPGCPRPLGDFDGNGKTGLGDCVGALQTIARIR